MKNILKYSLFISILVMVSCEDFLNYKDKDKIIPTTLENFSELAYTELMSNSNVAEMDYLNVMTDDIESFVTSPSPGISDTDDREQYANHFIWAPETQFTTLNREREDMTWNTVYRRILVCNVIEDKMNEFEDDTKGIRHRLLGEVKFIRAMSYFHLINLYAAPYITANEAKTQLAVPINMAASIELTQYKRSSMEEVCNLIEKNLLESIEHFNMGEKKVTVFRPTADAARIYLTRYYLYTKQWQKCVDFATTFLNETDHEILNKTLIGTYGGDRGILTKENKAIVFTWGRTKANDFATSGGKSNRARFITSTSLLSLYTTNDLRFSNFFSAKTDGIDKLPYKYDPFTLGKPNQMIFTNTIRYEEALLNRAEAYIALGNFAPAMADINALRAERFMSLNTVNATDEVTANKLLREEKRREFCFEGIRWFDIRRWNVEVTHQLQNFADPKVVTTYVLNPGSPNYIMPLPLNLVRKNNEIEQFTRINCQTN